jgi:methylmalonyl-CoA mutase N-terminal domain/subunit
VDQALADNQQAALKRLRETRDNASVAQLLDQVASAAQGDENMMPLFITCVENDVTLGEICDRLRTLWGEYQPPTLT